MKKPEPKLEDLLTAKFAAQHIAAVMRHYQKATEKFQLGDWETVIDKGGKFVEAVLKTLWVHIGETVPPHKSFKAGAIIDGLAKAPATHDDAVRLTIPRACRVIYDIARNRGGRHDPDEINPNQMDATLVVATSSWILADLLRYAQKGGRDVTSVSELVTSLNERKFPFFEDIDGRSYFNLKGLSARDVELLALWRAHPRRINKSDLVATAMRHGNKKANAEMGVSRLANFVDDDGNGNLRLRLSGVEAAEKLIAQKRRD